MTQTKKIATKMTNFEKEIEKLKATITEKDELLAQKDKLLAQKDELLAEKDKLLAKKDDEVAEAKKAKYDCLSYEESLKRKKRMQALETETATLALEKRHEANMRSKSDAALKGEMDREKFLQKTEEFL